MRAWGCLAYVKLMDQTKLEPRSLRCIFIGYPKDSFGYYFYSPSEQKVIVSRHAVFLENEFLSLENRLSELELMKFLETVMT